MVRHANCRWTNEVIEATAGNLMDGGDRRADALRNAVIFLEILNIKKIRALRVSRNTGYKNGSDELYVVRNEK